MQKYKTGYKRLASKALDVFANVGKKATPWCAWRGFMLFAVVRYIMNLSRKFLTSFDIAKSIRSMRSVMPAIWA